MVKKRPRVPRGLLIAIALTLILGLIAGPVINSAYTEEDLAQNVLLNAIPFILVFVAIILTFIALIVLVSSVLNNNISERAHKIVEYILMAGIILGIFSMFQPWVFPALKVGFIVLLISTLGFILWSHISPKVEFHDDEMDSLPASEIESSSGD